MDRLSKQRRSWNMSRIHGRDTKPEKIVRSALHRAGFRFRLCGKKLPGHPDIVLSKYKTLVFVHGCFWHRHKGCGMAYLPKSRVSFWTTKFSNNQKRDKLVRRILRDAGWKVFVIWECEALRERALKNKIKALIILRSKLKKDRPRRSEQRRSKLNCNSAAILTSTNIQKL